MEEKKKPEDFSSFAWDLLQQSKHQAKLWFAAFVITLAGLIGTNMAWLYVFQSYDYVDQFGDGVNSINSGTQGDIINEPEGKNQEKW